MRILYSLILIFWVFSLKAQYEVAERKRPQYHPQRLFSVELVSTVGLGPSQSSFMYFNTQYSLWQRPLQQLNLQTGVGLGFMQNNYGKMVAMSVPLRLLYAYGSRGHFIEAGLGANVNLGYSLADGGNFVPVALPSLGYRYQIPGTVFFHAYLGLQYHSKLGASPLIGIAVGYDY